MNKFVAKFRDIIKGVLTGFDRIVFKGTIMPLAHTKGAMRFCVAHGIHNKDFKSWAMGQTEQIIQSAEEYSREQCGHGITPIPFSKTRKETLAHKRQQELGIQSGLIGVWWAMESCWSYRAKYSAQAGYPQLRRDCMKCKHLYFYLDHPLYGFMNIRLQTWFPYHIQIALNGREWLRRSLERAGRDFLARGNKFVYIDDYDRAQRLLDRQLDTRWDHMLDGFLADVFPAKEAILGPGLSYYWTLWQSEWATDLIYPSPKHIVPIAESLMRHAFATGTSDRILRYLDHPLKKDGTPRADLSQEVASRLRDGFHEGLRVRHWAGGNSVKCYNELNVLRVEMTMNQPDRFRAHRHTQGQSESESKRLLPLRKGVADVVVRTQVSQNVNNRFMDNLATAQCETPVRALLDDIVKSFTKEGLARARPRSHRQRPGAPSSPARPRVLHIRPLQPRPARKTTEQNRLLHDRKTTVRENEQTPAPASRPRAHTQDAPPETLPHHRKRPRNNHRPRRSLSRIHETTYGHRRMILLVIFCRRTEIRY